MHWAPAPVNTTAARKCKCTKYHNKCYIFKGKSSAAALEAASAGYRSGNSTCRCSACGKAPANGQALCQAGACTVACNPGFISCGKQCISCPSKQGLVASCNATTSTCEYNSGSGCQNGTISCGGKCLACPQPPAGRAFCNDQGQCDLACTAGWTRKKDTNGVYSICEKDPVSEAVAMPAGNYTAWVGGLNTLAGFNGEGWEIRFPDSYITAIAVVNETWAAAVGGNDYYMFNGTAWLKFEDENGLWGIATGQENLWLVGEEGYVWLIYADATLYWGQVPGTSATLLNVAALVDKAAIAVGTGGTIVRVKGTDTKKWAVEASGVKVTLRTVATVPGQPAWIVGDRGTILRYVRGKWTKVASGTNVNLMGVAAVSDSLAFAVGAQGTILQWDGSKWSQSKQSRKWKVTFNAVTLLGDSRGYIVGDHGIMLGWSNGEWGVISNEGIGRYLAIATMPTTTSSGRKLLQALSMLPPIASTHSPANTECYKSTRTVKLASTLATTSGYSQVTLPVCPNPTTNALATNRCNRSATLKTPAGAAAVSCLTKWDGSICQLSDTAVCVNARCGVITDLPPAPLKTPNIRFLKYYQNTASGTTKRSGFAGATTVVDDSWFYPCVTETQTGWPEEETAQSKCLLMPTNPLSNGSWSLQCVNAASGFVCQGSCNTGYMASSPVTVTCSGGFWVNPTGSCVPDPKAPCPSTVPSTIPAANAAWPSCPGAIGGSTCRATCAETFKPDTAGAPVVTCFAGAWGGIRGACVPDPTAIPCASVPTSPLDNGVWGMCNGTGAGKSCTGECFGGFVEDGTPSIKCAAGKWDEGSKSGQCKPPAGLKPCDVSSDTCLTGACGVRCGVDPKDLLARVTGMQTSDRNAAVEFMQKLSTFTRGVVTINNIYKSSSMQPGPIQGGVIFNDGILGFCPMWPKTSLWADDDQDREALALKMAYKIGTKNAAPAAQTWVRTANYAQAINNIPFSDCDDPECLVESYIVAGLSVQPHPFTGDQLSALTFAAARRPCGGNRMIALGIDGLQMSIPLYPGPPSIELGLAFTGVGIYFDGRGDLGSLIPMLNPFEPSFEDFTLQCHLIVAGSVTVSAGLFYVPEGAKQPIQVTINGDMTLGMSFDYQHRPFRSVASNSTKAVKLAAGMYNLEVYPSVTFFEVLEIKFKSMASFEASLFVAMGKNSEVSYHAPAGEYAVVRVSSAFAMDLDQMVSGITLLNSPIPIAKVLNEFAGMYFPVSLKLKLETHAYLAQEGTEQTWGIAAYGNISVNLKLPWQVKPALKAADLIMQALARKRAGDLVPYFEGLNLGQTLNQLIDNEPVTAVSFEGGIVIRQLPTEDFWNLYLARKNDEGEMELSQVPTCGGANQAVANRVCGPNQFCMTGDSISTLAAVAAAANFLLPLPGNVLLGPALASLAAQMNNNFMGICANLGSRDSPCLSDFMCTTGNCISGTCSPGWPKSPCQQGSDCYGGGQCNQCIGTGRCPECDGECVKSDAASNVTSCRLAYRNEPCRFDSDCLSQRCNQGTYRNAARLTCGVALAGKPCINDGDCVTNRCINKKPGYNGLVVGVCAKGFKDDGCAGDGDCVSGRCTNDRAGVGYNDNGVWKSCAPSWPGVKCRRDKDCVTFNCIGYTTDEFGDLVGTCGKGPRGHGCGSDGDCLSGRCTTDDVTTPTNYYYQGAYRSCGPANQDCYCDFDCLKGCKGGKWDDDGPNNQRTVGRCYKGSKDEGCASDNDCLSGRCTTAPAGVGYNDKGVWKSCAPGWPGSKCKKDNDCVTFNCLSYATDTMGDLVGTCGKGPRGHGCGSDGDCLSGRCTTDDVTTPTNYYYQGAYRSCGPANKDCYRDSDCLFVCLRGRWGEDGPNNQRTVGQCLKSSKNMGCASDNDCLSGRCTIAPAGSGYNDYGVWRSCAPGWPGAKCRKDFDCVTFNCMELAAQPNGETLGTCAKGPRDHGCRSNADCVSDRCTNDGKSTPTNYYDGAYWSCGPRNMGCYRNYDCFTWCNGGVWDADPAKRKLGYCNKGDRNWECVENGDCSSNRCTQNLDGTKSCAPA